MPRCSAVASPRTLIRCTINNLASILRDSARREKQDAVCIIVARTLINACGQNSVDQRRLRHAFLLPAASKWSKNCQIVKGSKPIARHVLAACLMKWINRVALHARFSVPSKSLSIFAWQRGSIVYSLLSGGTNHKYFNRSKRTTSIVLVTIHTIASN